MTSSQVGRVDLELLKSTWVGRSGSIVCEGCVLLESFFLAS